MKSTVKTEGVLPVWLIKPSWRILHTMIRKFDGKGQSNFLNFGYIGDPQEFSHLQLEEKHEYNRLQIQLYCHTTRKHHFPGTNVLEVGCGRGGGAAFLAEHFKPASYTGLDVSEANARHCNEHYNVPGLRFVAGDAQNLPFGDAQFDAVVNLESSHCYPDIDRFFNEVFRVLKPGGRFLYADRFVPDQRNDPSWVQKVGGKHLYEDLIQSHDPGRVQKRLEEIGFKTEEAKDILPNVVAALEVDSAKRRAEIDRKIPRLLRGFFYDFAAVEGTQKFNFFKSGQWGYYSFSMIKP